MGSLTEIIFFGDMSEEEAKAKIKLLSQRISKGGELVCQKLLIYLEQIWLIELPHSNAATLI